MQKEHCFFVFLLAPWLFLPIQLLAQGQLFEICDNGIDDDLDGLIDLNDDDCYCPPREPISLIPNPSFEEQNCCPQDRSQLNCANDWIQASNPTTDLIDDCGWLGWDRLAPPFPFPDGSAAMGFRNGVPAREDLGNQGRPNWKEYAGSCLRGPLIAGETYRFEFEVGFTEENSPSTQLYFFGTPDCQYLPFGIDDDSFGCPTNGPNWVQLGRVNISGRNQWKLYEITVIPDQDINAIAIGPNCTPNYGEQETYYYFDNLILAAQSAFEFAIRSRGNPCSAEYELYAPNYDTLTYQWYLNGVALVGATQSTYLPEYAYGSYQVRLTGPNTCNILDPFLYEAVIQRETVPVTICNEEDFFFADRFLNQTGTFYDTLVGSTGCDSVVTLMLTVRPPVEDTILVRLLPGETHPTSGRYFSAEGTHDLALADLNGCDSLVNLTIDYYEVYIPSAFSPNNDGINDQFMAFTGNGVIASKSLQIYDRWGSKLYETTQSGESPSVYESLLWDPSFGNERVPNGTYIYRIELLFDDGVVRSFAGDVVVIR